MSIETLKDRLPDYAKDIKLNLGSLVTEDTLSPQQKWGCLVATAHACGNKDVIGAVYADAASHLSPAAFQAAQASAGIMAMNNIYYRFVHLARNPSYHTLQAKLRMNVIGNPGVEKGDFELWSLAVSAVNGCGMCIDTHEQHLVQAGFSADQIQTAVRIAAVIYAASRILDAEGAAQAVGARTAVA